MHAAIVPTKVNAEVASAQKKYEGIAFDITIEQMEPERLFSSAGIPAQWIPPSITRRADDAHRLYS